MDPTDLTPAQLAYARKTVRQIAGEPLEPAREFFRQLIDDDAEIGTLLALWGLATDAQHDSLRRSYISAACAELRFRLNYRDASLHESA